MLGGHDHHYSAKKVGPHGTWYVKSGADFKWLSKIDMHAGAGGKGRGEVHVQKLEVTSELEEEAGVLGIVNYYMDNLKAAMGRELGRLGCDLDARFAMVRTQETNCGNCAPPLHHPNPLSRGRHRQVGVLTGRFPADCVPAGIADIVRRGCKADCALINSGTLRADVIYPAGPFTVEDMVKLLPFDNHLWSVGLTGGQVLEVLENGVSQWPKKEGRFPQARAMRRRIGAAMAASALTARECLPLGGLAAAN